MSEKMVLGVFNCSFLGNLVGEGHSFVSSLRGLFEKV